MNKQLKKAYEKLDLPFSATVEEVELRKNALLKILRDEEHDKGRSNQKSVADVENSVKIIIENIKKNGTPSVENQSFDSSWASIGMMFVVLIFVAILCGISFYIFM